MLKIPRKRARSEAPTGHDSIAECGTALISQQIKTRRRTGSQPAAYVRPCTVHPHNTSSPAGPATVGVFGIVRRGSNNSSHQAD
ncbi:hypothetical protein PoB_003819600 [Plakobranchus ocellatus]|uniref:Uncharacterized protein n=1 Tax=Plakobranchus ocellatus TaxID=259542 RepID=A0AAV4AU98_9GAST|nr:hypothetical protein PoB_003819600 [Plakobranchus ocellatus]